MNTVNNFSSPILSDYCEIPQVKSNSSISKTTQTDDFKHVYNISSQNKIFYSNCKIIEEGNLSNICVDMLDPWKSHYLSMCHPMYSPMSPFGMCHLYNTETLCHYTFPQWYPFQMYNAYLPISIPHTTPPTSVIQLPMLITPSYSNMTLLSDVNNTKLDVTCDNSSHPISKTQNIESNAAAKNTAVKIASGKTLKYFKIAEDKRNNNSVNTTCKTKLLKRLEQKYLKDKVLHPRTNKCHSADVFLCGDSTNSSFLTHQSLEQGSSMSFPLRADYVKDVTMKSRSRFSNGTDKHGSNNTMESVSSPGVHTGFSDGIESQSMRSDCNYNKARKALFKRYVNRSLIKNQSFNDDNYKRSVLRTDNNPVENKNNKESDNEKRIGITQNIQELANFLCDFNAKDESNTDDYYIDIISKTIDIALRENSENNEAYMRGSRISNLGSDTSGSETSLRRRSSLNNVDKGIGIKSSNIGCMKEEEIPLAVQKPNHMKLVYSESNNTVSSNSNTTIKSLERLHKSLNNIVNNQEKKKYGSLNEGKFNQLKDMGNLRDCNEDEQSIKSSTRLEAVTSLSSTSTKKSFDTKSQNAYLTYSNDSISLRNSSEKLLQSNSFKFGVDKNNRTCDNIRSEHINQTLNQRDSDKFHGSLSDLQSIRSKNDVQEMYQHKVNERSCNSLESVNEDKDFSRPDGVCNNRDLTVDQDVTLSNENLKVTLPLISDNIDSSINNGALISDREYLVSQLLNVDNDMTIDKNDDQREHDVEDDNINKKFENITAHFIIPNCNTESADSSCKSSAGNRKFTEISFSVNYDPNNPELVMVDCAQDGKNVNESTIDLQSFRTDTDRAKDFIDSIKNIVDTNFYTEEPKSNNSLNLDDNVNNIQNQRNEQLRMLQEDEQWNHSLTNQFNPSTQSIRHANRPSEYSILNNIDTLSIISEEDEDSRTNTTFKSTTTNSTTSANYLDGRLPAERNLMGDRIRFMNIIHNTCDMCNSGFNVPKKTFIDNNTKIN